jgi:lysophospholipase L1-like esterase
VGAFSRPATTGMKLKLPLLAAALLAAFSLSAQDAKAKADAKKAKPAPSPVLAPITDEPGLPRVLLIGDSISMGYTLPVRERLKGKANVHRIPANGGPTVNGLKNLKAWLGTGKWDVIHFNFGIHDMKFMEPGKQQVPPEAYEKNLREIVKQLQATGARLIWATTTPIPDGELNPPRTFDKVPAYNAIATKVMTEADVTINDLNAHIAPHLAKLQNPKDVHFNKDGSEFLAQAVAAKIEAQLPKR